MSLTTVTDDYFSLLKLSTVFTELISSETIALLLFHPWMASINSYSITTNIGAAVLIMVLLSLLRCFEDVDFMAPNTIILTVSH